MNMDGTNQTLLQSTDDDIDNLLVYNDHIYYSIPDYTIFRTNLKGSEPEAVIKGDVNLWGTINICDNTIYYCDSQFEYRFQT